MRLLLISNSTNAGGEYLQHPKNKIRSFLGNGSMKILFIPYAGVTVSYDEYENKVKQRFDEIGHSIISIHHYSDPVEAAKQTEIIIVGGGNTFQLLKMLQDKNLIEPIKQKVLNGTPYIGWSAGSNIACPTICTTNDMPIVELGTLKALSLIPFQINPHFLDANPEEHAGETREMRIEEYLEINRDIYVVGLREGTILLIENDSIELSGTRNARIFRFGDNPREYQPGEDLRFLLRNDA